MDKPLVWLGTARRDVRAFPADARRRSGFQLRRVQQGLDPDDWKPMTSVGLGVREIRIQTELAHRVFYVATELKMPKKSSLKVTPSSGNVFRDLGFSADQAEHLLIRADLLIQLQEAIASRGLTQAKAAELLRVTQPRVSDLLRGRIDLFSIDSLIDMLARLGVHLRFVLKSSRRRQKVA
ncbi:MAG: XRE family transcriptional regulator [Acidobacteria bacterium]|nr:XRE family transcriptional regulator [Acidobacteriota bacterium]